ncbi:MAG: hypothetical protein KBS94_07930, partial [Prevotella sp.]|nr:hypothetical protein [Candidatus Equicola faecalis]
AESVLPLFRGVAQKWDVLMQTSLQHTFHFRTNHHTDDSKTSNAEEQRPQRKEASSQPSLMATPLLT